MILGAPQLLKTSKFDMSIYDKINNNKNISKEGCYTIPHMPKGKCGHDQSEPPPKTAIKNTIYLHNGTIKFKTFTQLGLHLTYFFIASMALQNLLLTTYLFMLRMQDVICRSY